MSNPYQLGWFSTGRDKAARDLLRAVQNNIKHNGIGAEIQFVFSNRDPLSNSETERFLYLANTLYKIPCISFPWRDFHRAYWRERTPREQMPLLTKVGTTVQAPYPSLVEGGTYHRRIMYPRRRQHRRKSLLYQLPLLPLGYQLPLVPGQAPSKRGDASEEWRIAYDRRVMKFLDRDYDFQPDLCVLAGYMLIVGAEMCRKYNMINLHPAAPGGPGGTWQQVIWQLIENQAQETGVMMHLVTPELDKGPPVGYCTFPIRGKPFDRYWQQIARLPADSPTAYHVKGILFRLIRQHGLAREFPLIVSTIKAFSEGKVSISPGKQVVDVEGRPINGHNLTAEINDSLKDISS